MFEVLQVSSRHVRWVDTACGAATDQAISFSMRWRYGIPLISSTSMLHWLISQSLFVIIAQSYQADGKALDHGIVYINGFSIQAILTSNCSEAFQTHALRLSSNNDRPRVCCLLGTSGNAQISRRRANASSCSAAISAACHPDQEDNEAHLFPVQWGVFRWKMVLGAAHSRRINMLHHQKKGNCMHDSEEVGLEEHSPFGTVRICEAASPHVIESTHAVAQTSFTNSVSGCAATQASWWTTPTPILMASYSPR